MLTEKRKIFVQQYILLLNASEAAIRAGYDKKRARTTACELLKVEEVQTYLRELQAEVAKKYNITVEGLVQELVEMLQFDVGNLYDEDGLLIDISQLPSKMTRSIFEINYSKSGGTKIKVYSKLDVIEKLAKHLGFYERDNKQQKPDRDITITVDSRETKDELQKLIGGAEEL